MLIKGNTFIEERGGADLISLFGGDEVDIKKIKSYIA